MSAFGPKQTSASAPHMSAFGGKADMPVLRPRHVRVGASARSITHHYANPQRDLIQIRGPLHSWPARLRGCIRVPTYHRLAPDGHAARRTIADALEVLHTLPDFSDTSYARIRVQRLRLPSGDLVGLIQLEFTGSLPEAIYVISLPTAARFRAKWLGCAERRGGDIFALDQATVDGMGNVTLADGRLLQAVEIIPARLPMTPSELDWRIFSRPDPSQIKAALRRWLRRGRGFLLRTPKAPRVSASFMPRRSKRIYPLL